MTAAGVGFIAGSSTMMKIMTSGSTYLHLYGDLWQEQPQGLKLILKDVRIVSHVRTGFPVVFEGYCPSTRRLSKVTTSQVVKREISRPVTERR